jgi:hypothetical protein
MKIARLIVLVVAVLVLLMAAVGMKAQKIELLPLGLSLLALSELITIL